MLQLYSWRGWALLLRSGHGGEFPSEALVPLQVAGVPRGRTGRRLPRVLLQGAQALGALHPGTPRTPELSLAVRLVLSSPSAWAFFSIPTIILL